MHTHKRVFVLGGYGETGKRLLRYLPRLADVELLVAGRDHHAAAREVELLKQELPEARAAAIVVDACESNSMSWALSGMDLFVHAGPALSEDVINCLVDEVVKAGADWIDVQVSPVQGERVRAKADKISEADLSFAIQSGFHPGMAAILVRYAALKLDTVESAVVSSFLNPEGGIPFTSGVDELVDMFRNYSTRHLENGKWVDKGGNAKSDYRKVDFPFGLGKATCIAMALDELDAMPEMVPGLQTTGFFIGGTDFITNWVLGPVVMAGIKLFPKVKDRTWGRLYCWSMKTFGHPPYGTALVLDATGTRGGKRVALRLALRHPDAYDFTAIPMAATAAQMLDGTHRPKGVHFAGHLADPMRLLQDMRTLGVEFLEETKDLE